MTTMRDSLAVFMLTGTGFMMGMMFAKNFQGKPQTGGRFVRADGLEDIASALDFPKQSPLQLLDAQFQIAGQALTDSLDALRNQAVDHQGDNQWDKAESDIAAKQTQLALAVMGKIGQLAEVAGAVDAVSGVVKTLKDEADRMKNATKAINQVNAVIGAANGVIGLVNNGGKKSD